jgi:hypothetical protein
LQAANRRRKRRLLSLSEADPAEAAVGLAVTKALDAVYVGDFDEIDKQLAHAVAAIGGQTP